MEVEVPNSELGIVSLIQAVKIPARHQKLVRVQVTNNVLGRQQLIFEPLLTNEENYCLLAPEALVSLDHTNKFNLILEPVYLELGQDLDHVGNLMLWYALNKMITIMRITFCFHRAINILLTTEQLADQEDNNASSDTAE